MFVLVLVGWVFFRSTDFAMAASLFATMFVPTQGVALSQMSVFLPLLLLGGWWAMVGPNAFDVDRTWRRPVRGAIVLAAALGASLAIMAGAGGSPFLYFQF